MLRRRARSRRRRLSLRPRRGPVVNSDLRAALRRVERRRAESRAAGEEPPSLEPRAAALRKLARATGWLGRRRMATLHVTLPVDLVESVLWLSGARTIREVVELALLNMILDHMAAEVRRTGGAGSFWIRARMLGERRAITGRAVPGACRDWRPRHGPNRASAVEAPEENR